MENLTFTEMIERLERLIDDCRCDICSEWIEPDEKRALELDLNFLIDATAKLNHLKKHSERIGCNIIIDAKTHGFRKECQIPSEKGLIDVYFNSQKNIIRLEIDGDDFFLSVLNSSKSKYYVSDDSGRKIIDVFKEGCVYVVTCLSTGIRREDVNLFRAIAEIILHTY